MLEEHEEHYVQTTIGVHYKFMKFSSFMAVSAAIMAGSAKDFEDADYWFTKACKDGIVFG